MTVAALGVARPLRVEMVLPSLVPAGMEVVTLTLARALHGRGHDVGITCIEEKGSLADQATADGIRVRLVRTPGLWPNFHPRLLAPALRETAPDVVHIHSGAWLKAARAARAAGVRTIVHTVHGLHEHDRLRTRVFMRMGAALTDWVVAVSEPLRTYLINRLRLSSHTTVTLLNGVDTDRFAPTGGDEAFREEFGVGDRHVIGMVARFDPVKDHTTLLDAFAQVRRQREDVALVLIGDGPDRASAVARVARLGLTNDVRFVGTRTDMPAVYRALDLFVLSSRAEGTSMSILEAMASGLPVVATAVGGTPHLLGEEPVGRLVPRSDPAALAGGILDVLGDAQERIRLGRAARDRCDRCFSLRQMVDRYEGLYRNKRNGANDRSVG